MPQRPAYKISENIKIKKDALFLDNRFRTEDIKYLNSKLFKKLGTEDIVYIYEKIYYRNIIIFVDRVKNYAI